MRTKLTLLVLLNLALSLPGAGRADPFAHRWCRLPTPRFEIVSDLKPAAAARLAEQMEVFRRTAQRFIQSGATTAELPLKVVVFRDRRDFRNSMKAPRFSGFMQPSLRESMLIIGPQQNNQLLHETALHEYAHYLLRNQIDVSFPVWYDEGLASFLSTMRITRREVRIGEPPPMDLDRSVQSSSVSLQATVQGQDVYGWEARELNDFYLMAWALVHYIELSHQIGSSDRRPQLETYLRGDQPPFETAFDTSYEALEKELQRYTRRRKLPSITLPRPAVTLPHADAECLSALDRDYELATAMMERNPQAARSTYEKLLDQDPADVRYLIGLSAVSYELQQYPESLAYARSAVELAPGDPAAQIAYATRLVHGCVLTRAPGCTEKWRQAVKLFRKAIRQDPQRFDAVLGLGLSYLHSGRPGDALNYLRIAYQKAPWAPHINFYLGECYRLIGDRRAVAHLTNARNWSTQEIWQKLAEVALAELR